MFDYMRDNGREYGYRTLIRSCDFEMFGGTGALMGRFVDAFAAAEGIDLAARGLHTSPYCKIDGPRGAPWGRAGGWWPPPTAAMSGASG